MSSHISTVLAIRGQGGSPHKPQIWVEYRLRHHLPRFLHPAQSSKPKSIKTKLKASLSPSLLIKYRSNLVFFFGSARRKIGLSSIGIKMGRNSKEKLREIVLLGSAFALIIPKKLSFLTSSSSIFESRIPRGKEIGLRANNSTIKK